MISATATTRVIYWVLIPFIAIVMPLSQQEGVGVLVRGQDCTPDPPEHVQIPPVEIMEPWNYKDLLGTPPECRPVSNFTDAELGLCRDYIEPFYDSIYVDILTPARLQIVAAASAFITGTDPVCGVVGLRHVCPAMFPQCIPDVLVPGQNISVNLRQYPCRELCEDVTVACLEVFMQQLGLSLCKANASLQCYPVGTWSFYSNTTRDAFPQGINGSTSVTIYNISSPLNPFDPALQWEYDTNCFNATRFYTAGTIPVVCPSGFVASGSFCSYECPYPFIEDEEYTVLWAMAGSIGFISLVCCLLLLCMRIFIPRLTLPREVFYMTVCASGSSFALFMGLLVGRDEMWCDDNNKPNLWGHPGCTIQGILLGFCTSAAICWWLALLVMIALIMALRRIFPGKFRSMVELHRLGQVSICSIGKRRDYLGEWKERFYAWVEMRPCELPPSEERKLYIRWPAIVEHVLCWGAPAVQILIALANQKIGYSGGDAWCNIQAGVEVTFRRGGATGVERDGGDEPDWWNLFLFTAPLLLLVLFGALLGTVLLVYIVASLIETIWKGEYKRRTKSKREFNAQDVANADDDEDASCLTDCKILLTRQAWRSIAEQLLFRNWRIFVYPFLLIVPFLFLFVFRIVFEIQKPAAQDELADSMSCTYVKLTAPYVSNPELLGDIDNLCDSSPDQVISFPLWLVYVMLFASWPILLLVVFGCRKPVFRCCWSLTRRSFCKPGYLGSNKTRDTSARRSQYTESRDLRRSASYTAQGKKRMKLYASDASRGSTSGTPYDATLSSDSTDDDSAEDNDNNTHSNSSSSYELSASDDVVFVKAKSRVPAPNDDEEEDEDSATSSESTVAT